MVFQIFPLSALCAALAGPALALCPSGEVADQPCAAAQTLADALTPTLPIPLRQFRLVAASASPAGLALVAQPAIGGPLPDPAAAATYLCDTPATRAFVEAGGTIDVTLYRSPFLTLTSCEAN